MSRVFVMVPLTDLTRRTVGSSVLGMPGLKRVDLQPCVGPMAQLMFETESSADSVADAVERMGASVIEINDTKGSRA